MTTDDLRTRAREAARKWEPACQGEPSTPSDYVSIGRRVGFEFGYLAHAAQQPTREQIARAIAESQNPGVPGAFDAQRGAWLTDADAVLALLTGDESDE